MFYFTWFWGFFIMLKDSWRPSHHVSSVISGKLKQQEALNGRIAAEVRVFALISYCFPSKHSSR